MTELVVSDAAAEEIRRFNDSVESVAVSLSVIAEAFKPRESEGKISPTLARFREDASTRIDQFQERLKGLEANTEAERERAYIHGAIDELTHLIARIDRDDKERERKERDH